MSFTESVKTCFNKYVTFKGRATRSEYWWFVLCTNVLVNLLPLLVFALFNIEAMLFACAATGLAVFLPMWSVTVRRLHDTNHSGWWILCPVYPIILMFMKGSEGENDYGIGENQLQLPCPICSELVDASVSVCPHCGEATHSDFVEPVSDTDKKVAIGVLALCGLLLIGGIAFSFSGDSTGIGGGYDLGEDEGYDLEVVDTLAVEIDDIDYSDDDSPNEVVEEWLDRLAWLLQSAEGLAAEAADDIYAGRQLGQIYNGASEAIETLEAQKHGMNRYQRQRYEQLVKRYKEIFEDY